MAFHAGRVRIIHLVSWIALVAVWGESAVLEAAVAVGTGSIAGRVIDAGGQGVPFAVVTFVRPDSFTRCFCDTGGDYRMDGLEPGEYRVMFFAGEFMEQWYDRKVGQEEADAVLLGADQAVTGVDAVLSRLGRVTGRVTDSAGQGIAGVEARFFRDDILYWKFTTGAEGNYSTVGLQPGPYKIQFFVDFRMDFQGEWYSDQAVMDLATLVDVPLDQMVAGIDAVLGRLGIISGRVTDPEGNGVAGAQIQADGVTSPDRGFAFTDAAGCYTMRHLEPGDYLISFQGCEYDLAEQWYRGQPDRQSGDTVTVALDQMVAGIDAQLEPGARISGRVTDADGQALAGAEVLAHADSDPYGISYDNWTMTDESGNYELTCLTGGRYKIECPGVWEGFYLSTWYPHQPSFETAHSVELASGQCLEGIDVQLERPASIAGRVTGTDGAGLPDIRIETSPSPQSWNSSSTDPEGHYQVTDLWPGEHKVYFRAFGAGDYGSVWYPGTPNPVQAASFPLAGGQELTGLDIQLAPGYRIGGRVTDEQGLAVDSVYVEAYDAYGQAVSWCSGDPDGSYELRGLPPGEYRLSFSPWSVNRQSSRNLVAEWYLDQDSYETATPLSISDQSMGDINVQLDQGGMISGMVFDNSGEIVSDVEVWASRGEALEFYGYTDFYDIFEVKGLKAGEYRIYAWPRRDHLGTWYDRKPGLESADIVLLAEGESIFLRIRVEPCGPPPVPALTVPATAGPTYRISWSNLGPAASYVLQEAADPSFEDAETIELADAFLDITHAVPDTSVFYYRVRAVVSCPKRHCSEWSETCSVQVTVGGAGRRDPERAGPPDRADRLPG